MESARRALLPARDRQRADAERRAALRHGNARLAQILSQQRAEKHHRPTAIGKRVEDFPVGKALKEAKPIYEYVKGWKCDITACRCVKDMPKELIDYVHRLEELVGCRIRYVSVGAQRDAYIKMY